MADLRWDDALHAAREHSKNYADALVQVLDTAWTVNAYLLDKDLPVTDALIANLTAQVLAREEQLINRRGDS